MSDDAQLQDTPLQLHLYKDSSNWIGSLTVDLNPLLARDSPYGIQGWFPLLTDEVENNAAEIFIQAKIQFFLVIRILSRSHRQVYNSFVHLKFHLY